MMKNSVMRRVERQTKREVDSRVKRKGKKTIKKAVRKRMMHAPTSQTPIARGADIGKDV